jgi:hypothetical protein
MLEELVEQQFASTNLVGFTSICLPSNTTSYPPINKVNNRQQLTEQQLRQQGQQQLPLPTPRTALQSIRSICLSSSSALAPRSLPEFRQAASLTVFSSFVSAPNPPDFQLRSAQSPALVDCLPVHSHSSG